MRSTLLLFALLALFFIAVAVFAEEGATASAPDLTTLVLRLQTAEENIGKWKHVSENDKNSVKTLVGEMKKVLENPNSTKDDLTAAGEALNKAVMECGKTEYQAAAAANKSN